LCADLIVIVAYCMSAAKPQPQPQPRSGCLTFRYALGHARTDSLYNALPSWGNNSTNQISSNTCCLVTALSWWIELFN